MASVVLRVELQTISPPPPGTFRCTFCQTEVEEDESAVPKKDARTLVARFNEQIEPIYALLRETEDVNLSHELLEPEPSDIPELRHVADFGAPYCPLPCIDFTQRGSLLCFFVFLQPWAGCAGVSRRARGQPARWTSAGGLVLQGFCLLGPVHAKCGDQHGRARGTAASGGRRQSAARVADREHRAGGLQRARCPADP